MMTGTDKQFLPAALAGDNPGFAEKDAGASGPYAEMLRKVDAVLREVFPEDFRPQLSFQHEELGFVDWKTRMPTESATLRIHLREGLTWQRNELKRSIFNLCQKQVTSMDGAGQGRLC